MATTIRALVGIQTRDRVTVLVVRNFLRSASVTNQFHCVSTPNMAVSVIYIGLNM